MNPLSPHRTNLGVMYANKLHDVRGNIKRIMQDVVMIFCDEVVGMYVPSPEYADSPVFQSRWDDDLASWNTVVAQNGLPEMGAGICDVAIINDDDHSGEYYFNDYNYGNESVVPYGTPDGITHVNMSRQPSNEEMIAAYNSILCGPEGYKPSKVWLFFDITPSMLVVDGELTRNPRSVLEPGITYLINYLTENDIPYEIGYHIERWLPLCRYAYGHGVGEKWESM